MKAKILSIWDRAMLSRQFIIETINDQLKNISKLNIQDIEALNH